MTLQPLWGASVSFDSTARSTGETGETVFAKEEGSYSWSVEMPSYQDVTGTVSINSDTTIRVLLVQTHASLKFRLLKGSAPVNGATVTVGDYTLLSNSLGMATFAQLPVSAEYSYTVSKPGYNDVTGSLFLSKDTIIDLEMGLKTGINPAEKPEAFKIWPNPADDRITISIPGARMQGSLQITDLGGHEIYNRPQEVPSITLDVKDYAPGMYIIRYFTGKETETGYFIKQ
jgi:hypothetical protein